MEKGSKVEVKLNNGNTMPLLGLGVYDMYDSQAIEATIYALQYGYRLIDTASMYNNEEAIGDAIKNSGIDRSEIFLTTKVNNTEQGYEETLKAYDRSLNKLKTDYVDLYLVHWPLKETRKETWLALEHLYKEGKVKSIGVANYLIPFLDELQTYASIVPAVNQVEYNPYLQRPPLHNVCQDKNIVLQAYTPLLRGQKMDDPRLVSLANKYEKTPAQIILRWLIQQGISAIPKSANKNRIEENFNIFDFEISLNDMNLITGFDENLSIIADPMELW